ncbi:MULTISPECIES: ExbD/TolR family protein [Aequorivita]|jgi:biopolymer transport protein TolR|uniref:Biopolymer transporter ExbD n=2 Tax=Aequorivita TaxID=153265 RepID=A0A137RJU6_9FLAO|nr:MULTISPECIES: biopolymer transporter ExbD [Aequorivita]MAB57958.1 biopolymer transporter ExbD [Aequorivita sp.]KJJ39705.1 biopolymer transporter ExbD [Aequorivita vladivostokensis]KXO00463.1 biopolymer transporter ExbD [Aequorivita aquimaris]MAO47218.1 biopolymer transporter ExbD [Aequorivita sp.]MBF32128.1 biopolymer transporter ExbD [Aequorivita sp.]|tara:strand:- start:12253 stop:12879 length:627 start_codon:yes stop_codon:yes gene_type:complete
MARRATPEVNAGSMADIAFLLLIFFLVTTTIEKDKGIARQLPPKEDVVDPPKIKEKNLFIVNVNRSDQLLVEEKLMELKDLRQAAIAFLDNGGAPSGSPEYCSYCKGKRDPESSDNPDKAVISVQNDRLTSYKMYIAVQNELVAAYNYLRDRESERLYGWKFTEKSKDLDEGKIKGEAAKEALQEKLENVQKLFPLKLSEAEPKKSGQ